MFVEIVESLGTLFTATSIARDSGIWFFQMNSPIFLNYMKSFLGEKGLAE